MGLVYTECKIANPAHEARTVAVPRLMVDTGAEATWVDGTILKKIGIEPRKKGAQYQMDNGEIITRSVGYAVLKVDARSKKLVAAGPIIVAVAVKPQHGKLIRVPVPLPKSPRAVKIKTAARPIRPKIRSNQIHG